MLSDSHGNLKDKLESWIFIQSKLQSNLFMDLLHKWTSNGLMNSFMEY